MLDLAVVGKDEFTLGFQLAGIKDIVTIKEGEGEKIMELLHSEVGIVMVDATSFEELDDFDKMQLEDAIKPVFVVMSAEESDHNLRRMIKKSIGVDVWEKGN